MSAPKADSSKAVKPVREITRADVPADQLEAVMTAQFEGLGHMERFEYLEAAANFRDVHERAPGWRPGAINLAIALLNQTGQALEASKTGAKADAPDNFQEALNLLNAVLEHDPDNPYARFCRGTILQQQGELARAHEDFQRVTELDPRDADAWFWAGSTLTDPDNPRAPAALKQAKDLIRYYSKALECNPYHTPALYKLAFAYRFDGQPKKQSELLALLEQLKPDRPGALAPGPGDAAEKVYGEMGRYATIINPFPRPELPAGPPLAPGFKPAKMFHVKQLEGARWAGEADFQGPHALVGRVRARFGAAVASFDANGDGKIDLYLCAAVVGPDGLRDALLLNRGDGEFEDVTLAFGLPKDRVSLGAAAGDFDADRHIDLFLTGAGENRLFRNRDGKTFEDVSEKLGPGPRAVALTARWLDLDQDGDLDLYVLNYCAAKDAGIAFTETVPLGHPNTIYRNDGRPEPIGNTPAQALAPLAVAWPGSPSQGGLSLAFSPWPDADALQAGEVPHTGLAALFLDDDRDLDLVVSADGAPPVAVLNDRLGKFHTFSLTDLGDAGPVSGLLTTDLDKDGRSDLVALSASGPVRAWRNATVRSSDAEEKIAFERWPIDAHSWKTGLAADLDLDGWPDLIGIESKTGALVWARNEGKRSAVRSLALGLEKADFIGFALADVAGAALPELVLIRAGEAPLVAEDAGNGRHWMALELGGHWRVKPELMRTNPHALGTRVLVEGQGLHVTYDHTTPDASLAQSVGRVVLGVGKAPSATLVHLRWPDGVHQCELNQPVDAPLTIAENNRKTGSCPVLFTWNGERFECIGDFLGGGGLGYLVAPGVYGQPDRDEAVAIGPGQLRPTGGLYRLAVTEPMDETAYLDQLMLDVVDRPPGIDAAPDERFVPDGPRPSGDLIAWRETIAFERATDLKGRDVSDALRARDRQTVAGFARRDGWIGYAEEHGILLDFGDRLARFNPAEPLVLCLAGWVEYPYSQTNYAAATAGVALRPPVLERLCVDGTWEVIAAHAGYPAGLPRLTTLELTGKLTGPRCVLRLTTNMECYWDQAFVAVRLPDSGVKVTALAPGRATLGFRGYTRELSPDGRMPFLYDYAHIDPAPLALLAGRLTRFGDVAPLLRADDDQLCLIGPGDEVQLEFDARQVPDLPAGWTRSFVLRAIGYCKDADPFTAGGDTVGPLPWKGMPPFPFGPKGARPLDPAYQTYLRQYQTRPAGGR